MLYTKCSLVNTKVGVGLEKPRHRYTVILLRFWRSTETCGMNLRVKAVQVHTNISPQKLPLWVPAQKGLLDTSRRVPTFRRQLPPSGHRGRSTLMTTQSSETSVQFYQTTRWHVPAGSSHHLENLVSPKNLVQYPKKRFSLPFYDPVNRSSLLSPLHDVCGCGWKRWLRMRGLAATNKRSWKKEPHAFKS